MIGDMASDAQAAKAAGCTSILVVSGHDNGQANGHKTNGHNAAGPADHVVNDLSQAVELILRSNGSLRHEG
jgi:phosphoglycolate phosphatase-like HAD superfamily hydrolase